MAPPKFRRAQSSKLNQRILHRARHVIRIEQTENLGFVQRNVEVRLGLGEQGRKRTSNSGVAALRGLCRRTAAIAGSGALSPRKSINTNTRACAARLDAHASIHTRQFLFACRRCRRVGCHSRLCMVVVPRNHHKNDRNDNCGCNHAQYNDANKNKHRHCHTTTPTTWFSFILRLVC